MSFDVGLEARRPPRSALLTPPPPSSGRPPNPLALAVAHSACSMHQWQSMCLSPYLNSAWQVFSLTRLPMHLIVLLASMRTVTGHLAHDATPYRPPMPPSPPPAAYMYVLGGYSCSTIPCQVCMYPMPPTHAPRPTCPVPHPVPGDMPTQVHGAVRPCAGCVERRGLCAVISPAAAGHSPLATIPSPHWPRLQPSTHPAACRSR